MLSGGLLTLAAAATVVAADTYNVPAKANPLGEPFDGFVSYSLEFSSFPDFAGSSTYTPTPLRMSTSSPRASIPY